MHTISKHRSLQVGRSLNYLADHRIHGAPSTDYTLALYQHIRGGFLTAYIYSYNLFRIHFSNIRMLIQQAAVGVSYSCSLV